MDIIELITRNCSCDSDTAREYLESEVRHLQELLELDDLRDDDLEESCRNLGLDYDYVEYFINRVSMV